MPTPTLIQKLQHHIEYASYRERHSERVVRGVTRLVEDAHVLPVWEALASDADRDLPLLFLDFCAHAFWQWERMPRKSDGEIRRLFGSIARDADSLAEKLDGCVREMEACRVSNVVADYLPRLQLPPSSAPRIAPNLTGSVSEVTDAENDVDIDIDDSLDSQAADEDPEPVAISAMLRGLAQSLRCPVEWTLPITRPRKRGADSAGQTFLVREVASFFLTHDQRVNWNWVGSCVSALTGSDALDGRHAKLLFNDLDDERWGRAEEYRPHDEE
jgi:hypothetical protein